MIIDKTQYLPFSKGCGRNTEAIELVRDMS